MERAAKGSGRATRAPVNGNRRASSLKRNQYGGTVGSRIVRDKVVLLRRLSARRRSAAITANNTARVPTALTLAGNFSVEDTAVSAGGCQSKAITFEGSIGGHGGDSLRADIIPASRFDPAGIKLLTSYLPVSTDPCGDVSLCIPAEQSGLADHRAASIT